MTNYVNYASVIFLISLLSWSRFGVAIELLALPVCLYFILKGNVKIIFHSGHYLLLFSLLLSLFFSSIRFSLPIDEKFILHFLYIFLLSTAVGVKSHMKYIQKIIKTVTLINLIILICGIFIDSIQKIVFFINSSGSLRFKSFYLEPSYLGITSAIFVLYLMKTKLEKIDLLIILLNALFIFVSFSGSGIALFIIIFMGQFIHQKTKILRNKKRYFILFVLIFIFLVSFQRQRLENTVFMRIEKVLTNNLDMSTYIRFVAPIYVLSDVFETSPMFGYGFGTSENYMNLNYGKYFFLEKRDFYGHDLKNLNIDNGYVYLFFSSGIIGSMGFLFFLYRDVKNKKVSFFTRLPVLLILFFTGGIAHFFFWSVFSFPPIDE